MKKSAFLLAFLLTGVLAAGIYAGDCPRFRGPAGDGTFPETGLLEQWPADGPKLAWSVQGLGAGFSSAVVVDGTVYVTGMDDQSQGILFAFDSNGSLKWTTAYGPEMGKRGPARAGTRGTPVVDGDRIFLMSSFGKLLIFERSEGKLLKTIDLLKRSGAEQAKFGFAECVQVDNDRIICTPGGPDASLMALDKNTGQTIWQSKGLSQASAYFTARLVRHGDKRLVVTMVEKAAVAVDPDTGTVLWQYDYPQRFSVQPNPPLYADGMIFICSGAGKGGTMLALSQDSQSVTPKWSDETLDPQIHGTVAIDGCIYGTAQSGNKGLVCLDWNTGQVHWNASEIKRGVVVSADGMLYVYGEDGTVHLVKPSADAFKRVSRFAVTAGSGEHWAHPTIANGRLYLRHGDVLMVYDIKADS